MKIPETKVTWFGVFHKMSIMHGRILDAVFSSRTECDRYITSKTEGTFAPFPNKSVFMIEPVEVKINAYEC